MDNDFTEDIAEGCLYGIISALPWQLDVALLVVGVIVWLLIGHPGF